MRMFLALAVIAFATPALADPAPATSGSLKGKSEKTPVTFGPIVVDGHREVPVAVVLTRDQSIKHELDSATDAHLMDAAGRR